MKVSILGAGIMGPGIAASWLIGGHDVVLSDILPEALVTGGTKVTEIIKDFSRRGLLSFDLETVLTHFSTTTSLAEAVDGAALVIECVPEDLKIKQAVYKQLDALCSPETIIVSNTSALPLPEILPWFRPQQFFICHYFNPPEIIPVVEIVRSEYTEERVVQWVAESVRNCQKDIVIVNGYRPGFLVNRLQVALMREVLDLTKQGIVSSEHVDMAIKAVIGFKSTWQGLFDTMDYIGLDTVAQACGYILPDLNNSTQIPSIILEKVEQGRLGVKSGQGFFDYRGEAGRQAAATRYNQLMDQLQLWNTYRERDRSILST